MLLLGTVGRHLKKEIKVRHITEFITHIINICNRENVPENGQVHRLQKNVQLDCHGGTAMNIYNRLLFMMFLFKHLNTSKDKSKYSEWTHGNRKGHKGLFTEHFCMLTLLILNTTKHTICSFIYCITKCCTITTISLYILHKINRVKPFE